jgi:hypothetical protein
MSVTAPEPTPQQQVTDALGAANTGANDSYVPVDNSASSEETPWGSILEGVPDSLRSTLDERLASYTTQLQQPYQGYEFLQEAEVDPDTVQYALNMLYTLNSNPRQLYDAIAEYYQFSGQQQQQGQQPQAQTPGLEYGEAEESDPRYAELEQQVQVVARALYEQQQAQQQAMEDEALESELMGLREKYGDFDEQYVLGLALSDVPLEEGVRRYRSLTGQTGQRPGNPAPVIMGSGGGAPGSAPVNPSKLSASDTKNLVVQMLQRANQE